ncbi:MAG: hypothetical protein R6X08_04970 [Desulfosalsimonadaceae bacterium]
MLKKALLFLAAVMFVFGSTTALAEVGSGKVQAKSGDVDWNMFGSLKTYPHFMDNADFNDDNTDMDWLLDENGIIDDDHTTVRTEARWGFSAEGKNFTAMMILEGDFSLSKGNTDRGTRGGTAYEDSGFSGEDFGIEKLEFTYDFSDYGAPMTVETGWQTKFLDYQSGGLLYGDDHPYIGLKGKTGDISWEALTMFIFDKVDDAGPLGGEDNLDWNAYTLKADFPVPVGEMHFSPFYCFSDNKEAEADVHYFGMETYGKIGKLIPRAEVVYAYGDKDCDWTSDHDADIRAYAAYASVEANISSLINPYIGGQIMSGDDDAYDDDIDAYNPITNISRYTPTFGMENAFIYRMVPALGSHLYANDFSMLGNKLNDRYTGNGYGGISNSSSRNSPGMISMGLGCKGSYKKFDYKTQLQYFLMEDEGALEDIYGTSIDDEMGWEYDLQLTYNFTKHFSIGNVISLFDPGDGIEDMYGDDYDDLAWLDTVEFKWSF